MLSFVHLPFVPGNWSAIPIASSLSAILPGRGAKREAVLLLGRNMSMQPV